MTVPVGEPRLGSERAERPSGNPRIGVIADDMTGAMDCGAQFPRADWPTRLILDLSDCRRSEVEVMVTETRVADPEQASHAIRRLLPRLSGRRLFKKIDSTMRGPVGAEVRSLLAMTGIPVALVCPAIIEEERTVRDGQLYVAGRLPDKSDYADNPSHPATCADIASILGGEVAKITLDSVRNGAARVRADIRRCGRPIVVADACTQQDLDCLARVAVEADILPVGAFGLAKSWLSVLSQTIATKTQIPAAASGKLILLMGSCHPAIQRQMQALREQIPTCAVEATVQENPPGGSLRGRARQVLQDGRLVVLHMPPDRLAPGQAQSVLQEMATVARDLCQEFEVARFFVSGGETASRLCQTLGTRAIEIKGELAPGLPFGILQGGIGAGAILITRAGGFGRGLTLLEAIAQFDA